MEECASSSRLAVCVGGGGASAKPAGAPDSSESKLSSLPGALPPLFFGGGGASANTPPNASPVRSTSSSMSPPKSRFSPPSPEGGGGGGTAGRRATGAAGRFGGAGDGFGCGGGADAKRSSRPSPPPGAGAGLALALRGGAGGILANGSLAAAGGGRGRLTGGLGAAAGEGLSIPAEKKPDRSSSTGDLGAAGFGAAAFWGRDAGFGAAGGGGPLGTCDLVDTSANSPRSKLSNPAFPETGPGFAAGGAFVAGGALGTGGLGAASPAITAEPSGRTVKTAVHLEQRILTPLAVTFSSANLNLAWQLGHRTIIGLQHYPTLERIHPATADFTMRPLGWGRLLPSPHQNSSQRAAGR